MCNVSLVVMNPKIVTGLKLKTCCMFFVGVDSVVWLTYTHTGLYVSSLCKDTECNAQCGGLLSKRDGQRD